MTELRTKAEIKKAMEVVYSPTTPMKAIRAKCKDCCCGSTLDIRYCTSTDCPLHPFRVGKNPFRKKCEFTDEQLIAIATRLSDGRSKAESLISGDGGTDVCT